MDEAIQCVPRDLRGNPLLPGIRLGGVESWMPRGSRVRRLPAVPDLQSARDQKARNGAGGTYVDGTHWAFAGYPGQIAPVTSDLLRDGETRDRYFGVKIPFTNLRVV